MPALFESLQGSELLIVLVVAVLVFGKNLPQVASQAARKLVQLRRQVDQAWRDTGMDQEIQQVRSDLESAIPRNLSIGEMARTASAEMDRRVREIERLARDPAPAAKEPASAEPVATEILPREPPPGGSPPA